MKVFSFILMALITLCGNAQDLHYSLFDYSPLNLNPGTVGQFDGTFRFSGNHRHQWKAVTIPYSTYSVGADANSIFDQKNVHGGIQINQDKAGDSKMNTFQVNLTGGYSKTLNSDSTLKITLGLQPSITNRSIDYTALQFDEQYNGWTYDGSLSNQENFQRESRTYLNLSLGAFTSYQFDSKNSITGGLAIFNLSKPKQSFFNDDAIRLDTRWLLHATGDVYINKKISVLPSFQFMHQGTYNELDIGGNVRYLLSDTKLAYQALYAGTFYRNKDAMFVTGGLDYDNWKLAMSYDINLSKLRPASSGRGAFELGIIYILKIYNPTQIQRRICRDFM